MADADRIRLAEAMGWRRTSFTVERHRKGTKIFEQWIAPNSTDQYFPYLPFNPFTDANDDYAVLEFLNEHYLNEGKRHPDGFMKMLCEPIMNYQIGDYARAALKVLEDKDDEKVICQGDFKCPACKTGEGTVILKFGACLEAELRERIEELENRIEELECQVIALENELNAYKGMDD